ncbi:MAG: hypothetical protein C0468_07030 [Planctomyces sp.]|nr:hypothetical protein [Planctomyces sp.]
MPPRDERLGERLSGSGIEEGLERVRGLLSSAEQRAELEALARALEKSGRENRTIAGTWEALGSLKGTLIAIGRTVLGVR